VNEHGSPEQQQDELRREIERTRAELGATVEALSQKADVKQQARDKVEQAKASAQTKAHDLQQKMPEQARERPIVPVAAGIGAALVALWLIRRR
jgi:hypothetical protein